MPYWKRRNEVVEMLIMLIMLINANNVVSFLKYYLYALIKEKQHKMTKLKKMKDFNSNWFKIKTSLEKTEFADTSSEGSYLGESDCKS